MHSLDYEPLSKQKPRSWPFWLAFASAYLPGLPILNALDNIVCRRLTGHHNDGSVMFLSLYASPIFAVLAGVIKSLWKRYDSLFFAAAFAILAPILAYLLWILVTI